MRIKLESFYDITLSNLETLLESKGFSRTHAKNTFISTYREIEDSPLTTSSLPQKFKLMIGDSFEFAEPIIRSVQMSKYDHSAKFVLETKDEYEIEMVLMPEKNRITICLSSQVGCDQGCVFCHTGRMGLQRNLTAGEIVSQVVLANKWISNNPDWCRINNLSNVGRVTNAVFMGMGEPLDNVFNVVNAIKILTAPCGIAIAPRKITVSTAGHIDGLNEFISHNLKTGLAFSLHALNNKDRNKIMPINRKWNLELLISWLEKYTQNSKRHVLIQYTLISGVNDRERDVEELASLLKNVNFKLNLIPLNPIGASRLKAPDPETIDRFRDLLFSCGIRVMVRYSKGQDIGAGCGQLVRTKKA